LLVEIHLRVLYHPNHYFLPGSQRSSFQSNNDKAPVDEFPPARDLKILP
jgi:hypothetical protein